MSIVIDIDSDSESDPDSDIRNRLESELDEQSSFEEKKYRALLVKFEAESKIVNIKKGPFTALQYKNAIEALKRLHEAPLGSIAFITLYNRTLLSGPLVAKNYIAMSSYPLATMMVVVKLFKNSTIYDYQVSRSIDVRNIMQIVIKPRGAGLANFVLDGKPMFSKEEDTLDKKIVIK